MNSVSPRFIKVILSSMLLSLVLLNSAWSSEQAQQSITISVSLDPELQKALNAEHTLFVYARAAQGPRMPLAIVRHKAGELPLEVKLDASMGMMPQMSLAKFKQVVLLARISASGNAMPQAGDMIGQTQPLEWQKLEQAVNIVINQQR